MTIGPTFHKPILLNFSRYTLLKADIPCIIICKHASTDTKQQYDIRVILTLYEGKFAGKNCREK